MNEEKQPTALSGAHPPSGRLTLVERLQRFPEQHKIAWGIVTFLLGALSSYLYTQVICTRLQSQLIHSIRACNETQVWGLLLVVHPNNAKDEHGHNALQVATETQPPCRCNMLKMILKCRPTREEAPVLGPELLKACRDADECEVLYLLARGANIKGIHYLENRIELTPIMAVCASGCLTDGQRRRDEEHRLQLVKLLESLGADVNTECSRGLQAIDYAEESSYGRIVEHLKKRTHRK